MVNEGHRMGFRSSSERLTTGEAAELCGVATDTMLRWVKSGRVRADRTTGGHHRIPVSEIAPLMRSGTEGFVPKRQPRPLYCWEYLSRDGPVRPECRECIVYRSGTALCFQLAGCTADIGHAKRNCRTSCEACAYYRRVNDLPANVLVITPKPESMAELSASGKLNVRFARNAYEASATIQDFQPGFAIIDSGLEVSEETELINSLVNDRRLPGLRVILAVRTHTRRRAVPYFKEGIIAGVLPTPFDAGSVESLVNCTPVPALPPPAQGDFTTPASPPVRG